MTETKDRETDRRKKQAPRKATPKYLENAALYYLSHYATSAENLRRVMMRKVRRSASHHGTDPEVGAALIEAMIGRFLGSALLDDGAYAKTRAESLHRRGNSARVIRGKLRQKGVSDDIIAAAIEALGDDLEDGQDPELAAAVTLAKRRRLGPFAAQKPSQEQREKHLAALARAGFSYDIARHVIDMECEEDLEQPS